MYEKLKNLFNSLQIPWFVLFILLLLISALGVTGYYSYSFYKKLGILKEKEDSFIKGKIVNAISVIPDTNIVSKKDFDKTLNELSKKDKEIKELLTELKKKKEIIVTKTEIRYKLVDRVIYKDLPSDKKEGKKYTKNIYFGKKVKVATVEFEEGKSNPWSYESHQFKFQLKIFNSFKDGKYIRTGVQGYVVDNEQNKIPIEIEKYETLATNINSNKNWQLSFYPFKLELSPFVGIDILNPNNISPGFSLSSHLLKLSKNDKDYFRFIGIHLGYAYPNGVLIGLTPAIWNLGSIVPFLSDLFINIGVGINLKADNGLRVNYILFFGLSTTL